MSYSYDPNGNTTLSNGNAYSYDFENRLISMNAGTAAAITISYDGDGNRVSKSVGGVTTRYLVDTNNPTGYSQVVEELTVVSGQSSVARVYAYGNDLISQQQIISGDWSASFYGYDGHGSVRLLTDSSGAVTDTYTYDAFGIVIHQTGSTPNDYLYAGEQRDSSLGLDYLRARYMNPATGRFWSADSFEGFSNDPSSLHKYLYSNGDPTNRVDPSGNNSDTLQSLTAFFLTAAILLTFAQITSETQVRTRERVRVPLPDIEIDREYDRVFPVPNPRDDDDENIVFRALRDDELDPKRYGISAKDYQDNTSTLDDHILLGDLDEYEDQYISTTRSWRFAQERALSGFSILKRIALIDLKKVKAPIYDLTTELGRNLHLKNPAAKRLAEAEEEVTILRFITADAVKDVYIFP